MPYLTLHFSDERKQETVAFNGEAWLVIPGLEPNHSFGTFSLTSATFSEHEPKPEKKK